MRASITNKISRNPFQFPKKGEDQGEAADEQTGVTTGASQNGPTGIPTTNGKPNLAGTAAAFARFLNYEPTPGEVLDRGISEIARAVGATHGEVLDLRGPTDELTLLAGHGFSQDLIGKKPKTSGPYDSFAGYCLHNENPVVYSEDFVKAPFQIPGLLRANHIRSGIGANLTIRGHLSYLLTALSPETDAFTRVHQSFIYDMVGQIRRSIEATEFRDDQAGLRGCQSLVRALLGELTTAPTADDLLQRAAGILVGNTIRGRSTAPDYRIADVCTVDLVVTDRASQSQPPRIQRLTMTANGPAFFSNASYEDLSELPALSANAGPGKVIHTGTSELQPHVDEPYIRAVSRDDAHYRHILALDPKSYLCVPLHVEDSLIGCLGLVSLDEAQLYDEDSCQIAEMIGQIIAEVYARKLGLDPTASYVTQENSRLSPTDTADNIGGNEPQSLPENAVDEPIERRVYMPESERLVFNLFTEGKRPCDIQKELFMTQGGYDSAVRRLKKKLGMLNMWELRDYCRKADPIP